MSACWTMMIGTTVTGVMAAGLPDEGLDEVFSGERLPIAAGSLKSSGRAEPVSGGYRVSGTWGFGSGIHHASWIVANCLLTERGEPRQPVEGISLAVPIAEVEVEDDWHVAGPMRNRKQQLLGDRRVRPPAARHPGTQETGQFLQRQPGPSAAHRTCGGILGRRPPCPRRGRSPGRFQASSGADDSRAQGVVPVGTRRAGGTLADMRRGGSGVRRRTGPSRRNREAHRGSGDGSSRRSARMPSRKASPLADGRSGRWEHRPYTKRTCCNGSIGISPSPPSTPWSPTPPTRRSARR